MLRPSPLNCSPPVHINHRLSSLSLSLPPPPLLFFSVSVYPSTSILYREVGTIIRSLNCYPSEAELHDMIQEVEEEEPTGFIRLEKFQPMMARVMMERRYTALPFDSSFFPSLVLQNNKNVTKSYIHVIMSTAIIVLCF